MGQYGTTAIEAIKLLKSGYKSAEQAWRESAEKHILAKSSRNKGCPRQAFLGLCASGLVVGVSPNTCTKLISSLNGEYSVTAVRLLVRDPNLVQKGKSKLWQKVLSEIPNTNPKKKHNEQMDVVMALWEQNLIVIDREAI
ncbi:DUF6979 family protein [Nostoc cycadae]|uniref:Uncharacterized protein n=1 Tax=Nostoc cycadae WK-1 TaxID=1861711 RepID=A0A2H6LH62_9NOSO|nr:hypothetical protein [Nostoc cycadae]GBE92565.1 hypothetical protein NCWK1_2321 [Nostoc cycadae WK-1]